MKQHGGKIPVGRAAHRRAGRARRLDHRARKLRHDELRRGAPRAAIRLRPRRLPDVSADGRHSSRSTQADYARWPSSAAVYLPNGRPPRARRDVRARPISRRTLQYMADEEKAAAAQRPGRRACRRRATRSTAATSPRTIVAVSQRRTAASLDGEDLAEFRVAVEPPVRRRFGDIEVLRLRRLVPGADAAAGAGAARRHRPQGARPQQRRIHAHVVTEALKLAFADRERLLRRSALRQRADDDAAVATATPQSGGRMIRPDRAWPEMPPPGEISALCRAARAPAPPPSPQQSARSTRPISASIDRWGNAFSATPSDGSYDTPIDPRHRPRARRRAARSRGPTRTHPCRSRPASGRG